MSLPTPPFRAEHVGSLLRPPELKRASRDFLAGKIARDAFTAVQDECIRKAVKMQEEVGLRSISDGEFRRGSWFGGFIDAVDGLTARLAPLTFQGEEGQTSEFQGAYTEGPLARTRGIALPEYQFVRSVTAETPKATLPAPSALHFFCFDDPINRSAYPEDEAFWADLVNLYHQEMAALAEAGATFLQFDECPVIMMADPTVRQLVESKGSDPDKLTDTYFDAMKAVLRGRPPGLRVAMHLCRGNYKGQWIGSGGYDRIAERLFQELELDAYYLEYDSERAGSFEPLRFLRPGVTLVLGLVNTKRPELETAAFLRERIEQAARFVNLDQLAISPQCGFASSAGGNPLTEAEQVAKLRRVVEVAREVWG
ncbi:MAG: 5-methyltetrahydropteroyltriglutamate--homocysteine S-methyltransferase [SAR324 cluster bacterium]|nr:5-methyltetrahydropteroyltriglutamate--homocysteine S-methyltransferase [SAR324 cluster bacterium]